MRIHQCGGCQQSNQNILSGFPPKKAPLEPVQLGTLPGKPLVSIIVPSYNQGRFIKATLDSILEQDYRPLRVHVIDGCSTDETVKVLESYGPIPELDWVSEPDNGVVDAVNKGFSKASGEIIGIQSSDDMYMPGAIKFMVEALKNRPSCGLIYGDIETIDANGEFKYQSEIGPYSLHNFLCKRTWIPQPSAFFRREMIEVCGGWNEEYFNADTELWLRMVFRTQVEKLDRCIAKRRLHDEQRNLQKEKIAHSFRLMMKNSPDVQISSSELKRAANAGVHLHAIKYNESNSNLVASYHLWRALVWEPRLWGVFKGSALLIPGWLPVRITAASIKKRFLRMLGKGDTQPFTPR